MKYKLLVLDIDGTLTNTKKEISPNTYETLIQAQKKGLKIVLASGRPTYGIVPLADQLRLDEFGGYILAYNGGQILDWKTKEVLHEKTLPNYLLPYLHRCAQTSGTTIVSYKDDHVVTENDKCDYVKYEAKLNKMRTLKTESFLETIPYPVPKCLIIGEPDKLVKLEDEILKEVGELMGVFRSEPFFLELVPKDIDKAQSLAHLLNVIGLEKEDMIACGDGYNDLSMIKFAGLGVAMANAQEVVRENADYITHSNDDEGVAHVVEQFYLSKL